MVDEAETIYNFLVFILSWDTLKRKRFYFHIFKIGYT